MIQVFSSHIFRKGHPSKLIAAIGLGLLLGCWQLGMSQTEGESENLPVDRPQNFQLMFNRGLLIPSVNGDDRIPVNGSLSGSMFFGLSLKFNFPGHTLGARVSPGINWYKLNYQQEDIKVFPTDTTFDAEKHVITYLEVPLSLYINISKDEDGDPKLFAEFGGFGGYKLSGFYKRKFEADNRVSKLKRRDVPNLEDWRLGLFARLGYKRWALYYSYLLSDTFSEFSTEDGSTPPDDLTLPPRMEVGISFFL